MPGTNDRSERWQGGYVHTGKSGRRTFVIHRMLGGRRYEISTKRSTEPEAYAQLVIFEKNPAAYNPTPDPELVPEGPPPMYLDSKLIDRYLEFCKGDDVGNSHNWWNMKRRFLEWWLVRLRSVDLRRADLNEHILPPLRDATSRQHRVATIKHLYSWLRDAEHGAGLISPAEDPTLETLKVPQARPQQWGETKAITLKDYKKVRKALKGWPRDALTVLGGTGWHYSELRRFAAAGTIEKLPPGRRGRKGSAVLVTTRKVGGPHRTEVRPVVVAAAKRIRAKGHLPEFHFAVVLKAASEKLGIEPHLTPGRFRHSVATWAKNHRAPLPEIATFLGHESPRTTQRFYSVHGVPGKVWTPV